MFTCWYFFNETKSMLEIMKIVFIGMTALYAVRIALEQFEFNRKERSSPISKQHRKFFNV